MPSNPLIELYNVSVRRGEPRARLRHALHRPGRARRHPRPQRLAANRRSSSRSRANCIRVLRRALVPAHPGPGPVAPLRPARQLGIVSNDWMQMCTRDYSGYEIVLSGFLRQRRASGRTIEVTPEMEQKARRGDGAARNPAPGRPQYQ